MCMFFEKKWIFLDEGTYNKVYVDKNRTTVLKIAKKASINQNGINLDSPERSVQLWNEINNPLIEEGLIQSAKIYHSKSYGYGWIAPYIRPQIHLDIIKRGNRTHVKEALIEI